MDIKKIQEYNYSEAKIKTLKDVYNGLRHLSPDVGEVYNHTSSYGGDNPTTVIVLKVFDEEVLIQGGIDGARFADVQIGYIEDSAPGENRTGWRTAFVHSDELTPLYSK